MSKHRLVIVCNDKEIGAGIKEKIEDDSFDVLKISTINSHSFTSGADAILVVSDLAQSADIEFVKRIYLINMGCPVIILCGAQTPEILGRALECGAAKVLDYKLDSDTLRKGLDDVIAREKARLDMSKTQKAKFEEQIVSVFGTKGGTGKTTVAVNMAIALSRLNKRVALIDLDLQFGDVGIFLDISKSDNIATLVERGLYTSSVILGYMHNHTSGVFALCAPPSPEYAEMIEKEHIEKIINGIKEDFDYIILDMPPAFSEISIMGLELSNKIFFVTNPDISTLRNTKISLEVMDTIRMADKVELVVNKDGFSTIKVKSIEQILEKKPKIIIPFEQKIAVQAVNRGVPVVIGEKNSKMAKAITTYVNAMAGEKIGKRKIVWRR